MLQHVQRPEDNLLEWVLSFHHVGPRGWTPAARHQAWWQCQFLLTILLITYSQLLFAGLSLVWVLTDSVVRLLWFLMMDIRVLLAITENPTTEFPNMWKCIYFSHVGIHVFICEHVYLYICVLCVELWGWVWESPLIAPCLIHVGKLWSHAQSSPPIRLAWLTSLLQGNLSHLLGTGLQRWNCVSSLCDRNINC